MVGEQVYFSRKPPGGFGITFRQPIIIININAQRCHHPLKVSWLTFAQGVLGTNVTIKVLCSMMRDSSLGGEPYARYAAVARLMLDTFSMRCLDSSYDAYARDMTNTSWEGPAAGGGGCRLL